VNASAAQATPAAAAVMSSACSFASLSPVECNPAGDGLGGAVARPKRRSCKTRAVTSRGPSAALPARESCPSWSDRRGPRCARLAPGAPQPGAAGARQARPARRRGRRALSRSLGAHVSSSGSAPGVASGGPHGPPLRETVGSPRGSGRLSSPRLTNGGNARLGGLPPRTPPPSLHRSGRFRAVVADRSGGAPVPAP
jgi:hypothetical protein